PYIRLIVGGIEAEQRATAPVSFGDRKRATVPDDVVLRRIPDAACGVLIGKRYVDFQRQRLIPLPQSAFYAFILIVEGELPFAVQTLPILPPELRTGIFLS